MNAITMVIPITMATRRDTLVKAQKGIKGNKGALIEQKKLHGGLLRFSGGMEGITDKDTPAPSIHDFHHVVSSFPVPLPLTTESLRSSDHRKPFVHRNFNHRTVGHKTWQNL